MDQSPSTRIPNSFRLPLGLIQELEAHLKTILPPPSKTAVVEVALREWLQREKQDSKEASDGRD